MSDRAKLTVFVIVCFTVSVAALVHGLRAGEAVPLVLAAIGFPSACTLAFLLIRHPGGGTGR
ncbi:hypothetical protein [Streptomyces sp. CO7]